MNALFLVLLATGQPGAEPASPDVPAAGVAYPEAGPSQSQPSHHGHHGFFSWLRGHSHHKRAGCNNPHSDGNSPPALATEAKGPEETGTVVDSAPAEPVPAVAAPVIAGDGTPKQMPRGEPAPARAGPPGK
jgi:hypothetical protein